MNMQGSIDRLSALPTFLRSDAFWKGALDPRTSLRASSIRGLREFSSTHRWGLDGRWERGEVLNDNQRSVIDVGVGILQRGAWTNCSWKVEQALAKRFNEALLGEIKRIDAGVGTLRYEALPSPELKLSTVLVTGRLPFEVPEQAIESLWLEGKRRTGYEGSEAEWEFYQSVLAPTLGFPLLDYVRFQPLLTDLGLEPKQFSGQRADFAVETGRGLKLVIEVDGQQHSTPLQRAQDTSRDKALRSKGWKVLRVQTHRLHDSKALCNELSDELLSVKRGNWGLNIPNDSVRQPHLLDVVWGATVIARIQFLLLKALQEGLLEDSGGWRICINELETQVAQLAIEDFEEWFSRLRGLYGLPPLESIKLVKDNEVHQLRIVVSVINPSAALGFGSNLPLAWSVPEAGLAPEPVFRFNSVGRIVNIDHNALRGFAADIFRMGDFREGQLEILERILKGQNVMGLLPTGGGKSLTYQLAAFLLPGATLYVAPLKSLLQDQFERLTSEGIDAGCFISSALTSREKLEAEARFESGNVRLLQVAPERFLMEGFRNLLATYQGAFGGIVQVVVDECHCVSEWGHDFRPAYLSLSRIVRERTGRLGCSAPVVALTGTASSIVLEDVRRELGMQNKSVEVRASRLDRPELKLNFVSIENLRDKKNELRRIAQEFIENKSDSNGGFLVFTGHTNGKYGVLDLAGGLAHSLNLTLHADIRVYSGESPRGFMENGSSSWDVYKSEAQRDFISGKPGNFQMMVATKAFGMGIDKPTIREIVHILAPQSPEAYYQEVGRAARDRKPAEAHLLFCDQSAKTTDIILSPSTDIDTARKAYQGTKGSPADFLVTFYFHAERFQGVEQEVGVAQAAIEAIRNGLVDGTRGQILLRFQPVTPDKHWREESVLEQSLVRLIHLRVVADYTKDYRAKVFVVFLVPEWFNKLASPIDYSDFLAESLETYLLRYTTRIPKGLLDELHAAVDIKTAEGAALRAMVKYLYDEIERKRRTATRTMLEISREGVAKPDVARKLLLNYLQVSAKFTDDLEAIAQGDLLSHDWRKVAELAGAPAEVDELRGAVARVLESYPTHPGLLFLSSIVRINPSEIDLRRSNEEFSAALQSASDIASEDDAAELAEVALEVCENFDRTLSSGLGATYAQWSIEHFGIRFALDRTATHRVGRLSVIRQMLTVAGNGLPRVRI